MRRTSGHGSVQADEVEDSHEICDPKVTASIAKSRKDRDAGLTRPASELLCELQRGSSTPSRKHVASPPTRH